MRSLLQYLESNSRHRHIYELGFLYREEIPLSHIYPQQTEQLKRNLDETDSVGEGRNDCDGV